MKRLQLATLIALLSLTQNLAQAQVLVDLPDLDSDTDSSLGIPIYTPDVPPVTPSSAQTEYSGTLALPSLTRKTGGGLYKIELTNATQLSRLEIEVTTNKLKIHSGFIITESGERIAIREFRNADVIGTNATLASENLNLRERVSSIELVVESYSGNANVNLKVFSADSVAKLNLAVQPKAEVKPTTPLAPPPPPPVSNGGNRPQPPPPPTTNNGNCYNGFCVNERVVYDNNISADIIAINSSIVTVRLDGYNGTHQVSIKSISKVIKCLQGFCVNEKAIFDNQTQATIVNVYSNNTARVILAGYNGSHIVSLRTLAKPINCISGMCVGQNVIYDFTSKAKILEVFVNNTARVTIDGYNGTHIVHITTLSKTEKCQSGICVGDDMMYDFNLPAKVLEVFGNQTARVTIVGYNGTHIVHSSTLTKPITCRNGICARTNMMYDFTHKATVLKVFSNDTAQVSIDGYNGTQNVHLNTLSKPISCRDGICAGDNVFYDRSYPARVLSVFSNNTAQVTIQGYNGTHNVSLSSLTKRR